jgi:hypothetical protein
MAQMNAIVDQLLSGVSSARVAEGTIAEQLLPTIKTAQYSGKLAKYGNNHLRIENSVKGGRGAYRRVEAITRSTNTFQIEGHGLESIVTAEDYRNVTVGFRAEEDEVMGLTTMLLLEKEKLLADTLRNTAVITQNVTLAGNSQLSDYTNSDPIGVINTALNAIRGGSGKAPNVAVMDWSTAQTLRAHPKFLGMGFQYLTRGMLDDAALATILGVQKILIAQATYVSSMEGQADTVSTIWGKDIVLAVAPDNAQPYQTSLGYLVTLEGETPRKVYKNPVYNPPGSTSILVEDNYDMLISNASAAYLIKNAVA